MKLEKAFYINNAVDLAPLLIGKLLCLKNGNNVIRVRITETEAYYGYEDTASHAHRKMTERNKIMFDEGGKIYVYLCYGIHNLMNIVSGN